MEQIFVTILTACLCFFAAFACGVILATDGKKFPLRHALYFALTPAMSGLLWFNLNGIHTPETPQVFWTIVKYLPITQIPTFIIAGYFYGRRSIRNSLEFDE